MNKVFYRCGECWTLFESPSQLTIVEVNDIHDVETPGQTKAYWRSISMALCPSCYTRFQKGNK